MGLNKDTERATYVNIKEGQLYTGSGDKKEFFASLTGTMVKVDFKKDEYNGKTFEVASIHMVDGADRFILQMRTDSGYFRGFCNSLKSGYPTEMPFTLTPSSKKGDNDKPQTTCFIKQDGLTLKHKHTKDNPGDLPPLEKLMFRGEDVWDSTKQIQYWKDWLSSLKFNHELLSGAATDFKEELTPGQEAKEFMQPSANTPQNPADLEDPLDDLPF